MVVRVGVVVVVVRVGVVVVVVRVGVVVVVVRVGVVVVVRVGVVVVVVRVGVVVVVVRVGVVEVLLRLGVVEVLLREEEDGVVVLLPMLRVVLVLWLELLAEGLEALEVLPMRCDCEGAATSGRLVPGVQVRVGIGAGVLGRRM